MFLRVHLVILPSVHFWSVRHCLLSMVDSFSLFGSLQTRRGSVRRRGSAALHPISEGAEDKSSSSENSESEDEKLLVIAVCTGPQHVLYRYRERVPIVLLE